MENVFKISFVTIEEDSLGLSWIIGIFDGLWKNSSLYNINNPKKISVYPSHFAKLDWASWVPFRSCSSNRLCVLVYLKTVSQRPTTVPILRVQVLPSTLQVPRCVLALLILSSMQNMQPVWNWDG